MTIGSGFVLQCSACKAESATVYMFATLSANEALCLACYSERANARDPKKPTGYSVTVPCARPGCGHMTVFPLGELDPRERYCAHAFVFRGELGSRGAFECKNCRIRVDITTMLDQGVNPQRRYDRDMNDVADEAQRLRDDNRALLAENGDLRRRLERLEARPKRP